MRTRIAAATVAASLAVGGLAGAALGTPSLAGAEGSAEQADGSEPPRRSGWVDEALDGLVEDGMITQSQSDAVVVALQEARPERRPGRFGGRSGRHLEALAEALDISETELRTALGEIRAGHGGPDDPSGTSDSEAGSA